MSTEKAVLCSPSKVKDFDLYLLSYPEAPLKIDLLVDLLLYPKLLISNFAYGVIFSQGSIEQRQWKRAFEDLINLGALDMVTDYPSRDENIRLLNLADKGDLPDRDSIMDLGILTMHSQKRQVPLVFRPHEVELFSPATRFVDAIADQLESLDLEQPEQDDPKTNVAVWMLEMKIPRLFMQTNDRKHAILLPGEQLEDFVFISPSDLVALLKDRKAIDQLRNHIISLASLDPTKAKVQDYLEQQRRFREQRLKVADITFEFLDLALLPIPPPFSTLAALLAKAAKKLTFWTLSGPYRWLLFTEEINAKLEGRK